MSLLILPPVKPSLSVNFDHPTQIDPRLLYTGSSPKTYYDHLGVMRESTPGKPVIEYGGDGVSQGISKWNQSTNEITKSNYDSSWSFNNSSEVISNYGLGLDGIQPTAVLKLKTGESTSGIYTFPHRTRTYEVGARYVSSVILRILEGTTSNARLHLHNEVYGVSINFALTASGELVMPTNSSSARGGVIDLGNGYKRLWGSDIAVNPSGYSPLLWPVAATSSCAWEFYGIQLEKGAYPSPLINTNGSQVTRAQESLRFPLDNCFKEDEGTVFVEYFTTPGPNGAPITIRRNNDNRLRLGYGESDDTLRGWWSTAQGQAASSSGSNLVPIGWTKAAISWSPQKPLRVYMNGALKLNRTGVLSMLSPTQIQFGEEDGSFLGNVKVRSFSAYPVQLPDEYLIAMTK